MKNENNPQTIKSEEFDIQKRRKKRKEEKMG